MAMERWIAAWKVRRMRRESFPHEHGRRVRFWATRLGHAFEIELVKDASGRTRSGHGTLFFQDAMLWRNQLAEDAPSLQLAYDADHGLWSTKCVCRNDDGFPMDAMELVNLFTPPQAVQDEDAYNLFQAIFRYFLALPFTLPCLSQ